MSKFKISFYLRRWEKVRPIVKQKLKETLMGIAVMIGILVICGIDWPYVLFGIKSIPF